MCSVLLMYWVTVKLNLLSKICRVCMCVCARHASSHRNTDISSLFFFRMQGDAKVEGEVSETVTLCFVSAGCMAGWVTDCCVLLWQKRAAACSSGTEAKRWMEWVQVNMLKQALSVIVLPCWHLSPTYSYFYSQLLNVFPSGIRRLEDSFLYSAFKCFFVCFFLNIKQ